MGRATAQIGDPSGKTKDRDRLAENTVEGNTAGIMADIDRIFTNILHMQKQRRRSASR